MRKFGLVLAVGALTLPAAGPAAPGGKKPDGDKAEVAGRELEKLRQEKLEAAATTLEARWKEYEAGKAKAEDVYVWSRRVLDAELEGGKAGAREAHLKRMAELEQMAKARYDAGQVTVVEWKGARFYRAEAEFWVKQVETKKK
jgi:hypothetical protein